MILDRRRDANGEIRQSPVEGGVGPGWASAEALHWPEAFAGALHHAAL
jgi:hypothetical protein